MSSRSRVPPVVVAIDPGNEQSAYVEYMPEHGRLWCVDIVPNGHLLKILADGDVAYGFENPPLIIEMVASYGMPVGREVFETVAWIGRFEMAWGVEHSHRIYRKDIKAHLCRDSRAKDSNIRQALIDRFGPGRDKAIGRKADPGPLYGVKKDIWSALAVAVTWCDQNVSEQRNG